MKVLVLGGGPAGLTAAYILAQRGFLVTVLEKDSDVGGLARTIKKDGFSFDLGGHRWYSESPRSDKFFKSVCGDSLLTVPRTTRIYFKGRFYNMPIKPLEVLRGVGLLPALAVVLDFWFGRNKPIGTNYTLEEAYTKQFGHSLFKLFFDLYNQKVWGLKPSEMSGSWIGLRTKGLTLGSVIKGIFGKSSDTESIDNFYYPKTGIGEFSQRLAVRVKERGGTVVLNAEITGFNLEGTKVKSVSTSQGVFEADFVISTLPLPFMVEKLSGQKLDLSYRDLVVATLFIKREQVTTDSWVYTQEPALAFSRFHEPKNWSKEMCPSGTTSLVCEFPCFAGDATWNTSDETLIKLAFDDFVNKMKLVNEGELLGGAVARVSRAYPIYKLGYGKEVSKGLAILSEFTNLKQIGRQGMFCYGNMDQPILSAITVAEDLIKSCEKTK